MCFVSKDQLDGKTKSAGATPRSGTPQRWVGPENLSSDEGQTDEEIGTHKTTAVRGTRRSLRKKKFNLTLVPPSDELVCVCVCVNYSRPSLFLKITVVTVSMFTFS